MQKKKAVKFLLYVPREKEKEFELYKKLVKELGFTTSDRIFSMISIDLNFIISVIEKYDRKGDEKE